MPVTRRKFGILENRITVQHAAIHGALPVLATGSMVPLGTAHLHQLRPFLNMLNNKRKGRASTLSKALLTAGLLGGAALSTLGAGSAQAVPNWAAHAPDGFQCTFVNGAPGTNLCTVGAPTGLVPDPFGDKVLTLLDWNGLLPNDTIGFTKQAAQWEVDLDFSLDRLALSSGKLDYKIDIIGAPFFFDTATLSTLLTPPPEDPRPPVGPFEVTKKIYSDSAFSNLILTLTNNNLPSPSGTLLDTGSISGTTIYVRDEWSIPGGSNAAIDAIQNNYTQTATQTPAPLPLLGAGAAFGFSRQLRKRIRKYTLA